uniref:Sodiumcoupled neutral amino acid transporter putativ n=1 Tax=Albugo laibachii Nc14 TaxID=890382 RepID=F0X135_9STRA|nr:sodiumcoupled neutral amino acid transporter putativ [Albugo laibachii Nc14]|eukprot:CCA27489.1 sodiumcoupled neutral amino acid transporter putativ [Albugo laibachii Nc14]
MGLYRYEHARYSMEYFSPGPNSQTRTAGVSSAVFNLISTMIGGGILSLPYAFEKCGLVLAIVLLFASAISSTFSYYVIVSCSRRGKANSYEDIVRKALGPWAAFITVVLLVGLTFLTMVGYVILMRDLVVSLASHYIFGREMIQGEIVSSLIICAICILPLLLLISMDSLRFTSLCSVLSISVLIVTIGIRAVRFPNTQNPKPHAQMESSIEQTSIPLFPSQWTNLLFAFPIICVAFLGQFNVLPIYRELRKPTRQRLKKILGLTIFSTSIVYMIVGTLGFIIGYRTSQPVPANILNMFAVTDTLVNVGRFGLLLTLLLNFPLLMQPCRRNLSRLFKYWRFGVLYERDEDLALLQSSSQRPNEISTTKPWPAYHVISTVTLLTCAVFMALILPDVAIVWNVMGSFIGLLISYILPCASYIRIRDKPNSDIRKMSAWVLLIISAIASLLCSIISVTSILQM